MAKVNSKNTPIFEKNKSIRDLAKEYGISTDNLPENMSISEYFKEVGRNDLSKLYDLAQRKLAN